ncbi:MAG: hypothetical protein JRJ29_12100, partial [Deltaproteobacteria bacterium]|nr:hypothetical protein [Deltaproteobacteria bacterium]
MSFFEFLSHGLGLTVLMITLLVVLITLGVYVWHSEKKQYLGSILFPGVLIAGSMVFLAITFSFPGEEAGPAAIPRLWIFWMVLLCSVVLWQVFRGKSEADPK